jgi:hypothetical protein
MCILDSSFCAPGLGPGAPQFVRSHFGSSPVCLSVAWYAHAGESWGALIGSAADPAASHLRFVAQVLVAMEQSVLSAAARKRLQWVPALALGTGGGCDCSGSSDPASKQLAS